MKRLFIGNTRDTSSLCIHCSGIRETELQAVFLGDIALSQYSSFSGRIALKGHSLVTLGKLLLFFQVSGRQKLHVNNIGEPLHIHSSGLLGDRAHQVNMTGLLRRWSCKEHSSVTQGNICTFI